MISKEYRKALDLIVKEVWPIGPEGNLHKAVSAFKMLIEEGHVVDANEIFYYLKDCHNDIWLASDIDNIYKVVKSTLKTEFGWKEDWLRKELFEDQTSINQSQVVLFGEWLKTKRGHQN
jgi:hypothetical protein